MKLSLFKNDLKQLKNTLIIFSSFLVLCLIISLVSFHDDLPIGAFYVIVLIFALVIPIINLNYLFDKTKQTHFASLPYTKIQGFIIRYLSGLCCLIVPVVLYCIIEAVLGKGIIIKNSFSVFLMIWLYYSLGNLTAYLTTTVVMNIILQIVIIISPFIMYMSLFLVYQTFVRGIVNTEFSMGIISLIMPAVNLMLGGINGLTSHYLLIYLIYGAVTFVLAFLACSQRDCVNSYHGFTHKIIGEIIKLVCIISVSWAITSILDIQVQSLKNFIIINVIATFVATFIIQFIQSKRIRYCLCIIQALMIVVATIVIFIGTKGYLENYIPKNISAVAIFESNETDSLHNKVTDPGAIEKVVSIHQELLKHRNDNGPYNVRIVYYKDNGDKVIRGYNISNNEYKEIVKGFNASLVKSWYYNYYKAVKDIDKCSSINYELAESNNEIPSLNKNSFTIENESDKQLFKNILQKKLQNFEDNPALLTQVSNAITASYVLLKDNKGIITGRSNYIVTNDPIDLAFNEYIKINAN